MTLLTSEEIDNAVIALSTIAIDAYRSGAIAQPTFEDLNRLTSNRLNDRWRRIQYCLTTRELVFHRRHKHNRYSTTELPRELSGHHSPEVDIFAATMHRMASEEGVGTTRDSRVSSPVDIGDDDWGELRDQYEQRIEEFLAPFEQQIEDSRERHFAEQAAEQAAAEAARAALIRSRPAPAPQPLPYGASPRGAELLVVEWMRHLGFLDAQATPERADGGIDATSETAVAQVKHYKGKVSVVEVRELFGVAASRGMRALFFTSAGYTAEAIAFATATEMPLFVYSAELGTLRGMTAPATALL
ncbi:restriction endonuclease [Microcella sp.]|uniref:restriction endonuclease n=1 Tax=Microcella sp. TaxID=1913979 RepID=UPI003F71F6B7